MDRHATHIKRSLLLALVFLGKQVFCQDSLTITNLQIDTSLFQLVSLGPFHPRFDYLDRYPDEEDEKLYKNHKYLIHQKPSSKNYRLYYSLACALWKLDKTQQAEKMFLTILNSNEKYYSSTYYHSSDIPGDTTTNVYGYGSFSSNYKNYSAIYLTKICLEQKKFDKALQFLNEAVTRYNVTYTCGTGSRWQQDKYDFLYASCYEGLKRHQDVIDLLLPGCLQRNDAIIISAIRNIYSESQIQECLATAETSLSFLPDNFPSYSYRTSYGDNGKEKTETLEYFSGRATIILFGKEMAMPIPHLENGQRLTREMLINDFKKSDFYKRLKNKE